MQDSYFIKFQSDISNIKLPEEFTFPFSYEPHPLTELAAKELQENLKEVKNKNEISGKMYGVLVVQNTKGDLGYLVSFSGQEYDGKATINFVPPIYNRMEMAGFYKKGEEELVKINHKIAKSYVRCSIRVYIPPNFLSVDLLKLNYLRINRFGRNHS
jgi:tRNA pseudouridine32 synthase/23S rRNA pseudouridine746 synthase